MFTGTWLTTNQTADSIDVIHNDRCGTPKHWWNNGCVFGVIGVIKVFFYNPGNTNSMAISNITVSNVRVDGDAVQLIDISPVVPSPSGSQPLTGYMTGFSIINVSADSESLPWAYGTKAFDQLLVSSSSAYISGVSFTNVAVGGACWGSQAAANLTVSGNVSGVSFACFP